MADAPNLPVDLSDGAPNHTEGHEDVNRSVNQLKTAYDGHAASTTSAHGGIIPPTAYNAKGDLLVATADNTYTRLGVGSDNDVLVASSAAATGLAWADIVDLLNTLGYTPGGGAGSVVVREEGTPVGTVADIDFQGSGVTVTQDVVNDRVVVTVATNTVEAYKRSITTQQSFASNSLTALTGLSQSVLLGQEWRAEGLLVCRADAAVDIKFNMTAPAGSTQNVKLEGLNTTATAETSGTMRGVQYGPTPAAKGFTGLGVAAGNEVQIEVKGSLVAGADGTWQPLGAQNVNTPGTPSVLLPGSHIDYFRVA